jgi:hypothetical protein
LLVLFVVTTLLNGAAMAGAQSAMSRPWPSANHYRLALGIEATGRPRSNSPATVAIDFPKLLALAQARGKFAERTVEIIPANEAGLKNPPRVPHRIERRYGSSEVILHFILPNERLTNLFIYFDTLESGRGKARAYSGLVGDGDKFVEEFGRREIAASHFDDFADLDGDGDLDLFQGGVEPFVSCWENVGRNQFVERGRLCSGDQVFKLPGSRSNRSWVTVSFFDLDGDGDQDFLPSFGDGPDSGQIVFYRNVSHEQGGQLTFHRVGPLRTTSGTPLAGGNQAGGWFPSITFTRDWDGDGAGPDALVGSRHHCWLYRATGTNPDGSPQLADAVAVRAGGKEIELVNPRFDCADLDGDGAFDLFAATQPGAVHFFRNLGPRGEPNLAPGAIVAWSGRYLIGDAHAGVKIADFDRDGLVDLVSGRFWQRTDLAVPAAPHDFGGFWKNVGTATAPRFARRTRGALFTEEFSPCDAIRQNGVRAVDWDKDGRPDLLAGDTDGFIWLFRNRGRGAFSVFERGQRLQTNGGPLSVTASGGHARFDVADWNNDGRPDLIIADGGGAIWLFTLRSGREFNRGERITSAGQALQLSGRASVLVCDWDNDRRKDLVLADDQGYYFSRNLGTDVAPRLAWPKPILFGGKKASYVRPNLGSYVDWDGDGKRDFIAGHFENSIRLYRNLGTGAAGEEPRFADPEGVVLIQGESPQMISGVEAVDWNGDGDVDILTGQGHGGSGLRFYERDWIEDELRGEHPIVTIGRLESKGGGLKP